MNTYLLKLRRLPILLLLIITGCITNNDQEIFETNLVVEGVIESDGYASVFITKTIPLSTHINDSTIFNSVVRNAKVTISCEDKCETLIGVPYPVYPWFKYIGNEIKGEEGKTYKLEIIFQQYHLQATTFIPYKVKIDTLFTRPDKREDFVSLFIQFTDPPTSGNFYKLYTHTSQEFSFLPSLLGNLSDEPFNGKQTEFLINKGVKSYPLTNYEISFSKNDTIQVKLSSVSEPVFNFWNAYENELMNGMNVFFPAISNLPGNINGALGIWSGESVSYSIYLPQ